MSEYTRVFSGFSVDSLDQAEAFYRDVLGLEVRRNAMGILEVDLPGGGQVIAYPKPDHQPATFTVLNFVVDDIDAAVDELESKGVRTVVYSSEDLGGADIDARGIVRGPGPRIAWFTDPAGNVLSVLSV